ARAGLAVDRGADIAPRADDLLRGALLRRHRRRSERSDGGGQQHGRPQVHAAYQVTEMYCVSRNSLRPSCAPSRPIPDCFMPPNGAAGSETKPRLRPIIPKSSFSETRMPRLMSFV